MKQSELRYKPWNAQDLCSSKEKGLLQSREVQGESQSLFGVLLFFCFLGGFLFFTGINHVLQAAFLNRTPKESPANEAAAGGEGPPHTPALGATPSPDPQRGSPERPFKVPGIFSSPALPF